MGGLPPGTKSTSGGIHQASSPQPIHTHGQHLSHPTIHQLLVLNIQGPTQTPGNLAPQQTHGRWRLHHLPHPTPFRFRLLIPYPLLPSSPYRLPMGISLNLIPYKRRRANLMRWMASRTARRRARGRRWVGWHDWRLSDGRLLSRLNSAVNLLCIAMLGVHTLTCSLREWVVVICGMDNTLSSPAIIRFFYRIPKASHPRLRSASRAWETNVDI